MPGCAGWPVGALDAGRHQALRSSRLTLPRLKAGDSRDLRGKAFEVERTPGLPDLLYSRGLPDPNRSAETAHPWEEGCINATASSKIVLLSTSESEAPLPRLESPGACALPSCQVTDTPRGLKPHGGSGKPSYPLSIQERGFAPEGGAHAQWGR